MAGDINTASGTKIYIGPQVAATVDTLAEFTALTNWVEIGLVESLGEFGDQSASVTFSSLNDSRMRKSKGTRDAGDLVITCAKDQEDPGQAALIAAEKTKLKYAFKIVLSDAETDGGTGTTQYLRALVMSKRQNVGSADNVIRQTFNCGIDSEIFEVDPT